ncbi:MAG: type II toxin-antitoxin system RelE/ParE family toxin [Deltaproteobacteria bacterium]|nr:type II toxin-antitoxin system RelE/ParE family toxin [Deltaproteobacteria bacterium]
MIKTFKNSATRRIYHGRKAGGLRGLDRALAVRRLDILDRITSLDEVPPLKSFRLHPLKHGRSGQWAMTINGPWRICFEWREGDAYNVEITDYHQGG